MNFAKIVLVNFNLSLLITYINLQKLNELKSLKTL